MKLSSRQIQKAIRPNPYYSRLTGWKSYYPNVNTIIGAGNQSLAPPAFAQAVADWQAKRSPLVVDGILGPNTWRVMGFKVTRTAGQAAQPDWLMKVSLVDDTRVKLIVHLVDASIASDIRFFNELADVAEHDVVVKLGAMCNGNAQALSEIRRRCPKNSINKLIVYGHGTPGGMGVTMGKDGAGFTENAGLTLQILQDSNNRKDWKTLRSYFRHDGVIVLRGCNTAQGPKGEALIKDLARITGVPVQASDWYQRVGRSDLLGNVRTATPGGTVNDNPELGQRNHEKLPFIERLLFMGIEYFNDASD